MPDDQSNPQAAILERARRVLPAGGFGNFAADIVIARGQGGHVELHTLASQLSAAQLTAES